MKKLKLTLRHFYAAAKYAGMLLVSLNLPRLPGTIRLWPGWTVPRCAVMLWTAALMFIGFRTDLAAGRAILRDREEIRQGKAGGGLNLSTFLALVTPLLFLLDAAAAGHFYSAWFASASPLPNTLPVMLHTALMAVGCVVWIYGRAMPALPCNSVWGFRTNVTLQSPESWRNWHLKASTWFCAAAIAILVIGMFIPAIA